MQKYSGRCDLGPLWTPRRRQRHTGYFMNAKAEALASNPEQLAKTNPQQLAVAYGVATDKWAALSGGPTAIVEHRRAEPTFADAQALIRQAQARVIDVEDGDPAAKSLPTNENEAK